MAIEIVLLYFYAYLVGSVPTAYLLGKLSRGVDLRNYGSGNIGGSNLVHHAGKLWLIPLIVFDVLVKGASPLLIGHYWLGLEAASMSLLAAPLLAVLGHNWSIFMRFQGGRGVAVIVGALLALSPVMIGAFLAVFGVGWVMTRSAGVWVLLSLAALPLWALLMGQSVLVVWFSATVLFVVLLKRLSANGTPMPQNISRRKVLLNRVFRDRDVDDRLEWINRLPVTDRLTG